MGPHGIEILKSAVGESRDRARRDVDYFYTEFRASDILEDDALAVGRPVRFQVVHGFRTVRRDLLRVVPLRIDDPDAPRASPGSIHGDTLYVGGEGWIESVVQKFFFGAGGEIFSPNIAALILAEYITRLELAARLIGANEQDTLAIRRPLRLYVISAPGSQLLRLSLKRFDEYLLEAVHFPAVGQAFFVGRPSRKVVETFRGGELNEPRGGKRIDGASTESFAENVAGQKNGENRYNCPYRAAAANRRLRGNSTSGCRAGFQLPPQALEIGIHFGSALAAQLAILFQGLAKNFFKFRGETAFQLSRRHGSLIQDSVKNSSRSGALERRDPRSHLIKHDAEGEQVGAVIEFLAERLLRRHVRHSTQRGPRDGLLQVVHSQRCGGVVGRGALGGSHFCQTEIQNLGVTASGYKDVGRFNVAVNDSLGVSGVESLGDFDG